MVGLCLRLRVWDCHDKVTINWLHLTTLNAIEDPFEGVDVARVVQLRIGLLLRKAVFETCRAGGFRWDKTQLMREALDNIGHLATICKNQVHVFLVSPRWQVENKRYSTQ